MAIRKNNCHPELYKANQKFCHSELDSESKNFCVSLYPSAKPLGDSGSNLK
ncbi:hypothetical protein IJ541_06910 [bacterium]|nr:hypothetical protein [bacterium]